jgi:DNA-binding transcriptional regulator YiaG
MNEIDIELRGLIDATGLTYSRLAEQLDANDKVVMAWYTGRRKPRHPAMLKRALQLIVLERRGVITEKLLKI